MDLRTKQDWCAALRSGQYKQGTGALRDAEGRYCCLGVLTDIVGEMPTPTDDIYDDETGVIDGMLFGDDDTLSPEVVEMVGLEDDDPLLEFEDKLVKASVLNDHKKLTFEQLADLIEAQL